MLLGCTCYCTAHFSCLQSDEANDAAEEDGDEGGEAAEEEDEEEEEEEDPEVVLRGLFDTYAEGRGTLYRHKLMSVLESCTGKLVALTIHTCPAVALKRAAVNSAAPITKQLPLTPALSTLLSDAPCLISAALAVCPG